VDSVRDYRRWLEPSPAFRSIDGHDKLRRVVGTGPLHAQAVVLTERYHDRRQEDHHRMEEALALFQLFSSARRIA
jgi:hypothetical protein